MRALEAGSAELERAPQAQQRRTVHLGCGVWPEVSSEHRERSHVVYISTSGSDPEAAFEISNGGLTRCLRLRQKPTVGPLICALMSRRSYESFSNDEPSIVFILL